MTSNEYTVKDSFEFSDEVVKQQSSFFMASLDVDSLFTNIPLKETIKICISKLYSETETINGIPKAEFCKLLELATQESFFIFNGKYYKQIDGVAMGSPLGPALANAFMCHYEKIWLDNCPKIFKPVYYRRYVDDIFVLFSSPTHVEKFRNYMSSQHKNINFSQEQEVNVSLSFLDILVTRESNQFTTNIYRKPTFSGVFTNFESYIPIHFKRGLVFSLLYRGYNICSDFKKFHNEISELKNILRKNAYPMKFIDSCIKIFLDKIYQPKSVKSTVPKKDCLIVLPYLGRISLQIRSKLNKVFKEFMPYCNLRIVYNSNCRLKTFFRFKDSIPKLLRSGVVYKYQCSGCNATYYGKTKRHLKVRISEHFGISALTGKNVKNYTQSSIKDHFFSCDHTPSFDDFSILTSESNDFKLLLMESLLINRDKPILNKTVKSFPLELF